MITEYDPVSRHQFMSTRPLRFHLRWYTAGNCLIVGPVQRIALGKYQGEDEDGDMATIRAAGAVHLCCTRPAYITSDPKVSPVPARFALIRWGCCPLW